jgi:hypothetical protein
MNKRLHDILAELLELFLLDTDENLWDLDFYFSLIEINQACFTAESSVI